MKTFAWIVLVALLAAGGWFAWKFYLSRGEAGDALLLIPDDAVFAIVTDDPIASWKTISGTTTWAHLQTNSYFASLTSAANSVDSLIRDNEMLFDLIGSHALIVSAHMTGTKDYDFLFLVDLKGASGIKFINEYLTTFKTGGISIKKEKYFDNDVVVVHDASDNTNLYVSVPGTFLVMSYTKKVLQNALDAQLSGATLSNDKLVRAAGGSLGTLYFNYNRLPEFVSSYSDGGNEYAYKLSESLISTNLDLEVEDTRLTARGTTTINDSVASYVRTLSTSGKAPTTIFEIAPLRTAFCMTMGFSSFGDFFTRFEENIKGDVKEYQEYRENLSSVENYLKIDMQKQFVDWVGEEVAFLELQSAGKGLDNEFAVALKASNIETARDQLQYIEKMVRKRTPVKFKSIDHRGYSISYLGMKGVFKVLLGKFFARYDKPYYTIINDFVVFSNHPQTLESIIDDYLDRSTLGRSPEFKAFRSGFEDESSVFIYVNTPVLFNTVRQMVDSETRMSMDRNKDYIVCFRHIGFQMVPEDGKFKTLLTEEFKKEVVEERPVAVDSSEAYLDEETPDSVVVEEPSDDLDPMELPYIYVKDLNAKSFTGYYDDNTTVHFTVELKNGFKDGSYVEYFENGKERMTGKFKRDKRDGHWRLYDEEGNQLLHRVYDNGTIKKERD